MLGIYPTGAVELEDNQAVGDCYLALEIPRLGFSASAFWALLPLRVCVQVLELTVQCSGSHASTGTVNRATAWQRYDDA